MPRRSTLSLLLVMGLFLLPSASALANSAPPRWGGERVTALVPDTETAVTIESEQLLFRLNEDLSSAEVAATYQMRNPTARSVTLPVIFAALTDGPPKGMSVFLDGVALAHESFSMADTLRPPLQEWFASHPALAAQLTAITAQGTWDQDDLADVVGAWSADGAGGQVSSADIQYLIDYARWLNGEDAPPDYVVLPAAQLLFPQAVSEMKAGWVGEEPPYLDPVSGESY